MTEKQAQNVLDGFFLTDEYGMKIVKPEAQRAIIASLCALPAGLAKRYEKARAFPNAQRALVELLCKHPDPLLLQLLLASYRRMGERPDPATRAQLDAIKGLAGPLAKQQKAITVAKLTFRAVKRPARDKLTGVRARQVGWALRQGFGQADLELFDVLDEQRKHVYDAIIHAGDDGKVFTKATMKTVATFAQGGAEGRSDALCSALEQALARAVARSRPRKPGRVRRARGAGTAGG